MTLFPRVVELLREKNAEDITVFGGGIIPDEDIPRLEEAGLAMIFTPGTPLSDITDWVSQQLTG
jgi:methylmalonyl-CoA mutase C-terminal domain/subunit